MSTSLVTLVAACIVWVPALSAQSVAPRDRASDTLAQRIARVEQRLWPSTPLSTDDSTGWSVNARLRAHRVPGMSVAVVRDGRLVWARAYGVRDARTGAPLSPTTMLQAGSISKPLASLVALRLVDDGRVTLDGDVNQWLRRWRVPRNAFTTQQPVSLRRLLTHTAGVTVRGFDGYVPGQPVPSLQQILDGRTPANSPPIRVDTTPGAINRYSGGGFMIAQAVMEDVTGVTFDRLADSLLLSPLHLTRTTYRRVIDTTNAGDVASGHASDGARIPGKWRVLPEMAAASLWSTPTELATVMIAMQRAAKGQQAAALSPAVVQPMMRLHGTNQGIGIGLKGDTPFRFSHAGSNDGFQAQFIGYLDRDDGIVVMTNGDNGTDLAMEYIRAVAREFGWDDLAPRVRTPIVLTRAQRQALVGQYQLGPNWTIDVRLQHDTLVAGPTGRRLLPLLAEDSSTLFFTAVEGVLLDVLTRQDGLVESIAWTANGRRTIGHRVRRTLLSNVTVIDGTGAPAQTAQDIVIRDGRIAEIVAHGRAVDTAFAERLALDGRVVMPGLIDAHVHMATYEREPRMQDALLKAALLGGVTTVRDMGGNIAELRAMAARANAPSAASARLYYSAVMSGPQTMWFTDARRTYFAAGAPVGQSPGVRAIGPDADISRIVAEAQASGATGLKLYATLPPATMRALTREAKRRGMRVWAHLAIGPGSPTDVVRAGVDAVSHADMFVREIVPVPAAPSDTDRARTGRAFATTTAQSPRLQSLLHVMKTQGTALDATLQIMYSAIQDTTGTISPDVLAARQARYRALFAFASAMTKEAHRQGVPILAGTDALGRGSPTLHLELQLLVEQVGLTPLEAIHAATLANARALGIADSLGSVSVGKVADLVVLRANPLRDIANTLTVESVIRGGAWHTRERPLAPPPHARAAPGASSAATSAVRFPALPTETP
ncbi:MAG: serine hydrolase [Gemmatimonadaceae bacterium]|nr:serine hydrolase [Gemmatimonadaceae bacterium]